MNLLIQRKTLISLLITVGSIILVISNCAHLQDASKKSSALADQINPATLSNPRQVSGELIINFNIEAVLADTALATWKQAHGIPINQPPLLRIWSSDITEQPAQQQIQNREISVTPTGIFIDSENGNRILYWDLSDSLKPGNSFSITRRFEYTTYDFAPRIDPETVAKNWKSIPESIRSFYTKPEQFLEQTPEMITKVKTILGDETNPFRKSELIFNLVQQHMTYAYPPKERGAVAAFENGSGDCGQYSALFISLCRIAGIPARQQSGFNFMPDNTGYHVWAEIFLPTYGWIPMDPTRKNGFNFIDNKRLLASVGMNIPLKYVPAWSTYEFQEAENGRTPFMQLFSMVASGIEIHTSTELNVLESIDPYSGIGKTALVGPQIYKNLAASKLPLAVAGESTAGRPIYLLELGSGANTSLIFGGFHGDEEAGTQLVLELANILTREKPLPEFGRVIIVPVLNPDGLMANTRTNFNGVDINRNFPTNNWSPSAKADRYYPGPTAGSEIETLVAIELIKQYRPDRIITVHAPLEMINYDGPATEIANIMARYLDYPVTSDIGYPTPGSFGTYTGVERNIPVITLELPQQMQSADWVQNLEAIKAAIRF